MRPRADWLEDANCLGAPAELVDVAQAAAADVIRAYCWRCPVVLECRAVGDAGAPHRFASVFGGRYYPSKARESRAVLQRKALP